MTNLDSSNSGSPEVARALTIYKAVTAFNFLNHLAIGLACLFFPYWVADLFGLPDPIPTGWTRGWGATLILVTALYIPGWLDPLGVRAPNLIGIGGRIWMATVWVFCGGGFLWFALFDYSFAALIGYCYWRLLQAAKS